MPVFLRQLKEMGFAGVQNFPTVGLIDGVFRQNLEETGMGFELEVDMIRQAHALDLLTTPYVFTPDQARRMAEAGADLLVAHMGSDHEGVDRRTNGAHAGRGRGPRASDPRRGAGDQSRSTGAVSWWSDRGAGGCRVRPVADRGLAGFFGASSVERLPTEVAITENMRRLKALISTRS